ncbi:AraC family transcriptional regulator [Dokdonella sp.]|uniref:AraC family transcriptional regulator n=1 Tax=Dokdonella sp. TaxID=2291710 RepID=UPI001B2A6C67|nr:AraC family transcriptional regulator [Dokdonella sp.]MBO9662786.1 AraC family transcriptional regulator [Dokdonella sp.]
MTPARSRTAAGRQPAAARAAARGLLADARYTAAVIPTTILAVLAQLADAEGVAVEPWLAGLGITRAQIDDASVRVSYRQASLIIKRALRAIPRSEFGLEVGSHQSNGTFGVMGLAMMTARTFGDAVAIGVEYADITGALMDVETETPNAHEVALVARPRFPDEEILVFLCEELFASTLQLARGLVGGTFKPECLELTYPAPPHAADYRKLFGCEIRFGASRNRMVVGARWLEQRLPTHHPVSAQQALAICREQAAQIRRQSEIIASVERILRRRLAEHPTLSEIAQNLNLSERTLRRHLATAGRVYRDIHDQLRAERALELLSAGALSIAAIGSEVGYSDAREFRRAFKRWTGAPPTAMRHAAVAE